MTIYVPNWMQGGSYAAHVDRWNGDAAGSDEGIVFTPLGLKVVQRGAGANISVDVGIGEAIVQGDDQAQQGNYRVVSDAVVNVALSAVPGSNSRYDLIILQVNDPDAGGAAGNNAVITKVTGTAASSPTVPALPNSAIALAVVGPITSGTASITNAIINDAWSGAGPAFASSCRLMAGPRTVVGEMRPFGANTDKISGWLPCDGTAVSRTTYAALYAMIGTLYGVGNGSTTFNLPNLSDRVPVAKGATFGTIGAAAGEVNHTLTTAELAAHNHGGATNVESATHTHTGATNTDGAHEHPIDTVAGTGAYWKNTATNAAFGGGLNVPVLTAGSSGPVLVAKNDATSNHFHYFGTGGQNVNHVHGVFTEGSGTAHNNMQPYQVIAGWAIRT